MLRLATLGLAVGCLTCISASTLQRLSLKQMILKSTAIVQAKVQPGTSAALRGPLIYTHYQISVTAVYKGTQAEQSIDVAVPGGQLNGMRQPVAGAPTLTSGQQYVFFLWTSKSGLTQVIGLSQGLFAVVTNSQGQAMVSRGAADAMVLDSSGNPVTDTGVQMPLAQLVSEIQSVLAASGGTGGSSTGGNSK